MKKLLTILVVTAISITLVFTLVPNEIEKTINEKAPKLLEMNEYVVIEKLGFQKWKDQTEYVVEKNGKRDTIAVRFYKGQFSIQPK